MLRPVLVELALERARREAYLQGKKENKLEIAERTMRILEEIEDFIGTKRKEEDSYKVPRYMLIYSSPTMPL